MGLLDALFSNDSYGGQGGGLLDFLRNSQMQNSQYQPAPGFAGDQPSPLDNASWPAGPNGAPSMAAASFADRFNAMPNAPQQFQPSGRQFDAASFNPSTYAPNQAQPIAVGDNYQMPRVGSADQFALAQPAQPAQPAQAGLPSSVAQPRATDFSAQSAQRQQPDQALPPALQSPNFLSRIGHPDGLIARLTGNDTRSISQQNLRATFDATRNVLRQSGMSDQEATSKAMLAVLNPEAGKVILPEALSNRQKFEKLKDGFGNENPVFVDTVNHTVTTADGKPYGQGGGAAGDFQGITDKITDMRSRGASTEQMLKMIPTGYRDDVASLIAGKAVPANMGRSEVRGKLITLAKTVDPNFDETLIPTRIAMRKDFAGEGKNGISIGNFNTAAYHIDKASDALERMAPYQGDYPTINAIRSFAAGNINTNPKLRDATAELNNSMNAVDHEVAAAYNSGHLSDSDRQSWEKLKNPNLPPDVLRRGLSDFVDLLNGKRDSLNHMYQQTFHEDAPTIDKETNAAITAKVHSRLPGYAKEQAPSSSGDIQEGRTATNPQTGAKITFKNGKWQ